MQNYIICQTAKRKTLAITISQNLEVKVRAPKKCDIKTIEKFIEKHKNWIDKKLAELEGKSEAKKNTYSSVWYLGQEYPLQIIDDSKKNIFSFDEKQAILFKNPKLTLEKSFKLATIELSKETFSHRLITCHEVFKKVVPSSIPHLKIKFLKSRWGSLSHFNKEICLNAKLIYTKPEIIDYVIMHELCHIKHKNHGKNFYKLFLQLTPDLKEIRKSLKIFFKNLAI